MKHISGMPDEKFLLCALLPIAVYLLAGICHIIDVLLSSDVLGGIVIILLYAVPLYSILAGLAGIFHALEQRRLAVNRKLPIVTIILCMLHMLISIGILFDIISFLLHPPT